MRLQDAPPPSKRPDPTYPPELIAKYEAMQSAGPRRLRDFSIEEFAVLTYPGLPSRALLGIPASEEEIAKQRQNEAEHNRDQAHEAAMRRAETSTIFAEVEKRQKAHRRRERLAQPATLQEVRRLLRRESMAAGVIIAELQQRIEYLERGKEPA